MSEINIDIASTMIFEWAVRKKLFRNINHAIWFLMSVWILILTIAYYFYLRQCCYLLPISYQLHAIIFCINVKKVAQKAEQKTVTGCDLSM